MSRLASTSTQIPAALENSPSIATIGRSSRNRIGPFVWLAAALALLVIGNGRWTVPAATWMWPVLLVRFLRSERLWGLGLAAAGMTATAYVSWWGMVPAPIGLYFVILLIAGLLQVVPFAIDRLLFKRFDGLPRTLILPTALVSLEFFHSERSPAGTWGALGYTQFGNLSLVQLVSVTGVFGITFLIGWFATVFNDAWEKAFEWRRIRGTVGSFGGVFAVVFLAGTVRLTFFPPDGQTVRIASLTAPDALHEGVDLARLAARFHMKLQDFAPDALWQALVQNGRQLNEYLIEQSRREARAGAQIVFWPEGQAVVAKESEGELVELGRQTARSEKIYLGMGVIVVHREFPGTKIENRFVFLDPAGKTVFDYSKQMPVPGGEAESSIIPVRDFRLPVVETPHGRIAGAICFDMDFSWLIRQAGLRHADMILAPSNDWRAIDPLHTHMALLRGIELGCSVVRHTSGGLSAAADYQGRPLTSMDHFTTPGPERVMVAHVPVRGVSTFYARYGDVFSWSCVCGLLVLSSVGLARRPKEPAG